MTFVMTDVVGSTSLTRGLGDQRAFEVMGLHDHVVREVVCHTDGEEVERVGDGFLLAFPGSDPALRCALLIRAACEDLHADLEGLEVRIGVHSGTAIHERAAYFGVDLILCARIRDASGAGEILCSRSTRDGSSRYRRRFGPCRTIRLKGFGEAYDLYPLRKVRRPARLPALEGLTPGRARDRTP